MRRSFAQLLLLVIGSISAQVASGIEADDTVSLGIGGINPMPHCEATVYTVEYERRFIPSISFLVLGSTVIYTSDDKDFLEDGTLQGADVGFRYYPAARPGGFFTGLSAGYWIGEWDFVQNRHTLNEWEGDADTTAFRMNLDFGYRFVIEDTNLSVTPMANIGRFFSSSSCDYTAPASQVGVKCDQESVVNNYIFAGISLGFTF